MVCLHGVCTPLLHPRAPPGTGLHQTDVHPHLETQDHPVRPTSRNLSGLDIPISCARCHVRSQRHSSTAAGTAKPAGLQWPEEPNSISQKHTNQQILKQLDRHHSSETDGCTTCCGGAEYPDPNPLCSFSLSLCLRTLHSPTSATTFPPRSLLELLFQMFLSRKPDSYSLVLVHG